MSYIQVRPGFYEMYQPDGPWSPGAPGWSRAPVPMWGNNPNLRGPRMLATHGLGQDNGKGAFVVGALLFGLVGLGVFMLSAKEIGKKPARRYARNEDKPRRVQMRVGSAGGWFKAGQYGIVRGTNTTGGMWLTDKGRESRPSERALLVGKSPRSGALWFSEDAVRYTRQRRK